MSDMTFTERKKLEELLNMSGGYVLGFSNREFSDFVQESIGKNIYEESYASGGTSKANRLRAFFKHEPNLIVGKLLKDLIAFYGNAGQPLVKECERIADRLVGRRNPAQAHSVQPVQQKVHSVPDSHVAITKVKEQFERLRTLDDRQEAGLLLEKVLNELFTACGIAPRGPFRVVGEQIDGSFELDHEIYLLEAKWQREPTPAADLYVFREKIEGKSKFTRGVFLTINGCSSEAQEALTRGKQPNFFVMNGHDLMMVLDCRLDLKSFLRLRQRVLAEEGKPFCAFSSVMQ